jgi:uncharacterized protein (DUF2267 family)
MADFDDLLTTVRMRSVLRDPSEARLAISAVAGSLAACLGEPEGEASGELTLSVEDFIDEVARRSGWSPERSRYAAQAVLSSLAENDPQLRPAVLRRLPQAVELFSAPGAPA